MPKRTRKRNYETRLKYKRARKHNANVTQNTPTQAHRVKVALIAQVKKYPILCTSLDVDDDSETYYGAWEKIAEQLNIDECTFLSRKDCITMWKSIKRSFISYIKDDIHTRGAVIRAMQCLFPDFNEENLLPSSVEDENDALSNSSGVGSDAAEETMRPKTNRTAVRKKLREPPKEFKLALIEEVKKYPPLWTSLDVDADSEKFYSAWEKIAEALQIDDSISTSPVDYCRKTWKILKIRMDRYIKGDLLRSDIIILTMLHLFPECYEMLGPGRRRAVVKYVDDSAELIDEDADESESNNSSDENNESNNCSEVESVTAESEQEIMRPTTNNVAQAATPGNPRSIGARSTERAVSLAIVNYLFDSLRSPAAKTDVCNLLIQALHKYRPNIISEIIEYGARQTDLFNVDWSGLPIPEDLSHEIWRRDVQKNVRTFYKNNSSKRRAKKGN